MIEQVKKFIQTNNLITSSVDTVFVGVSGGIDSCVLLDILYRLRSELNIDLKVVHFNHKVRAEAAYKDEEFVKELAQNYGLSCQVGRLRGHPNKATETYLREHRIKFYNRILEKTQNAIIATGHNLDDNIETFLMRLAKGSRLRGLLGIRAMQGQYIRPLLQVDRNEIQKYAQLHSIKYREDKSNFDTRILRNRIRHEIVPFLREHLNERISPNIVRTMYDLSEHYKVYEQKLKEAVAQSTRTTKNGILLNRKRYQQFSSAVRRGLIEYCISTVYPLNYTISDSNLVIWDDFIKEAQAGKKNEFLENGVALAERNHIVFGDIPKEKREKYRLNVGATLTIENRFQISLKKIFSKEVKFSSNKDVEYIDGNKSGDCLLVRFWQKGDRFKPLGMGHRRKLSDFFIDLKLGTSQKNEIPIVCKETQIIWIAGYRLDDRFKISDKTKKVYKLEITKVRNI